MNLLKLRNLLITITIFLVFTALINNISQAQEPSKETHLQERKAQKASCPCAKPAIDSIQKAYTTVEEDEWGKAIKACKDAIASISNLAKTCKCPEVDAYRKVAEAFLKYAEGGNHLDGADEPNCPFALKLYTDAISLLKDAIPNISNEAVIQNANNIQEYAKEEQQFVKDECQKS